MRVSVYAGIDPLTGHRHYLKEIVKAGPKAQREAEAARNRLLSQVAEKRSPRTGATVDQLLTRYLDQFVGSPNTLELYRTHVRNHISPCLGHVKGRPARPGDPRLLLRRAPPVPAPLLGPADDRAPGRRAARVRRPLRPAPVQAAGPDDYPAHSLHPVRRLQARGPMAMVEREPDGAGRAASRPEAEPAAADSSSGGPHRRRVVARSGLGRIGLDSDDHGRPPRGDVRGARVVGRPRQGAGDDLVDSSDPSRTGRRLG